MASAVLLTLSSANERLPNGPWARTWLCSLILSALALSSLESWLRAREIVPTLNDSLELWCRARSQVRDNDRDQVAVVGSSRIRLALDTEVWTDCFDGKRPIMLAIEACSPYPILFDLCMQSSFSGIILCDVSPAFFFKGVDLDDPHGPNVFLARYRKYTASDALEQELRIIAQEHLAFRRPNMALTQVAGNFLTRGKLPSASYRQVLRDRSSYADYSKIDLAPLAKARQDEAVSQGTGVPPDQLGLDLQFLNFMVDRIQSRGGRVIFVRVPISGFIREVDEKNFPRKQYWDMLASTTHGLTINFADYLELSHFICPEGGHMDLRDRAAYTRSLARIIQEKLRLGVRAKS
jgi:hypothetical protein